MTAHHTSANAVDAARASNRDLTCVPLVVSNPGYASKRGLGSSGALIRARADDIEQQSGHIIVGRTRAVVWLYPATHSACHQQDNQHEENNPAKTTPHRRATQVKTASAEQQQKDDQQNDHIHSDSSQTSGKRASLDHEP